MSTQKNSAGSTALLYAAFFGKSVIDLLIKNGADVKTKNDHGITPLMFAAKFGDLESVGVLIENGADINARDNDGKTAAD